MEVYYKYSTHLKEKYGEKVYKIPVNLPVTCPNRDGSAGHGGCTFCGDVGAGYEMRSNKEHIRQQVEANIEKISSKYKANAFIPYLQNYSNTYMPLETFKEALEQVAHEKAVGVAVSTRPDCIHKAYLDALDAWSKKYNKTVNIELGLQTINYKTLEIINRGHGLAEYLDAVMQIKAYPHFTLCTHIIVDLPWDTMEDVIETARCMSALRMDYVKLHALYIVKNTKLAKAYEKGELDLVSLEEYKARVITFLRHLSPEIVIQRIIGRAPEEHTLYANWNTSWWKIHDDIVAEMTEKGYKQGDLCNYLNGKAVRKFVGED